MHHSDSVAVCEVAPAPKKRTPPSEQTDEAPGLIDNERVDIEREAPLGENESIERNARDNPESEPPAFEE